jgi:hypothetical protein
MVSCARESVGTTGDPVKARLRHFYFYFRPSDLKYFTILLWRGETPFNPWAEDSRERKRLCANILHEAEIRKALIVVVLFFEFITLLPQTTPFISISFTLSSPSTSSYLEPF